MRILTTSIALFLLTLTGCSTTIIDTPTDDEPFVAACEIDAECDPGDFCSGGVCEPVEVDVGGCASRADCPSGQVCVDGSCGAPPSSCAHSEECPDALLCDGFSGTCFDPDASGCQTDDECRLEPGCEGGCRCSSGACSPSPVGPDPVDPDPVDPDPVDPDPIPGDAISLDNYTIENREHDPAIQVGVLSGISLSPGQVLVIGRNATKAEFEADWGVSLGANVVYFNNANQNGGVPVINGNETWALLSPSGTILDGETEPGATGKSYQRTGGTMLWSEVNDTEATPGTVDLPATGVGLVISEWSDASGTGRFPFEFLELYYAP
jgi:hypothetical protein